jgi:uncharacterized protein
VVKRTHEMALKPEEAFDETVCRQAMYRHLKLADDGAYFIRPLRRSIDARSKSIVVRFLVEVVPVSEVKSTPRIAYPDVRKGRRVVIVGSGPAGLFAALRLMESGVKPIVLERGKDVQSRRRDLAAINKDHVVNPDSNYCFGEGGAGTYSDGKLYTRSKKRGDVKKILEILVSHGAHQEILFDSHPHIGTNKLPQLVASLRETILSAGGEIHFLNKVSGLLISGDHIKGVMNSIGERIQGESVILATGHSSRDIFRLLHQNKILIEPKPFALGIRVEHPQSLIDKIQYHCTGKRSDFLPASSYALVHQTDFQKETRGVFSFCMCPGGFIVPAATSPGEVVVNGMSPSRRDSRFANSGIVVEVKEKDFGYRDDDPLAAMNFQENLERKACAFTGGGQRAPAQRLVDYLEDRVSLSLPETSYQPGLASVSLREILPEFITESLLQGFKNFGSKMRGYLTNEAQIIGVESRTSSPVKIPRHEKTLEHVQLQGLFPCGEGAGYAGGIVSAAIDGQRCAEAVLAKLGIRYG